MLKRINNGKKPTRGSRYSAAVDLYANIANEVTLRPGGTAKVNLGVCIDQEFISEVIHNSLSTIYLELHPRSSLRAKGIMAGVGIVDIDYPDEIAIILHNTTDKEFAVKNGDRIAQIIAKHHHTDIFAVETDEKRTGGFGSTNDKQSGEIK